jgi:hypothetical protein
MSHVTLVFRLQFCRKHSGNSDSEAAYGRHTAGFIFRVHRELELEIISLSLSLSLSPPPPSFYPSIRPLPKWIRHGSSLRSPFCEYFLRAFYASVIDSEAAENQ